MKSYRPSKLFITFFVRLSMIIPGHYINIHYFISNNCKRFKDISIKTLTFKENKTINQSRNIEKNLSNKKQSKNILKMGDFNQSESLTYVTNWLIASRNFNFLLQHAHNLLCFLLWIYFRTHIYWFNFIGWKAIEFILYLKNVLCMK